MNVGAGPSKAQSQHYPTTEKCGILIAENQAKRAKTMSITITLPPATEAWLQAQAKATGKDVGALVVESVEARQSMAQMSLREILAPVHADFHKSGMSEAELDMLLSDELAESRAERNACNVPSI